MPSRWAKSALTPLQKSLTACDTCDGWGIEAKMEAASVVEMTSSVIGGNDGKVTKQEMWTRAQRRHEASVQWITVGKRPY